MTLTLTVEAEPNVTVEMPAFGEALGRFSILDFTPRESTAPDGTTTASQRYTLQAPMSGKQRIPPLRLEFLDRRGASDAGAAGDVSADAAAEEEETYRELLTDELTIDIASVLPEGEVVDELRPARDPLPELRTGFFARYWPWLFVAALLVAGLIWFVPYMQRRARERARESPRTTGRYGDWSELEQRGLPARRKTRTPGTSSCRTSCAAISRIATAFARPS